MILASGNIDTEALTAKLKLKMNSLQMRLERITSDVTQEHSSDSAEQAQERENDEVIDAIGNETRLAISNIQLALSRIEEGCYGICDKCGEEIDGRRLEVIPEATRCTQCEN